MTNLRKFYKINVIKIIPFWISLYLVWFWSALRFRFMHRRVMQSSLFLTACKLAPCIIKIHIWRHLVIVWVCLYNQGLLDLSALSLLWVSQSIVWGQVWSTWQTQIGSWADTESIPGGYLGVSIQVTYCN